ncbi:MAG: argininosuccinate lyase, partial [Lachnospiraceae bacterium]|nr:argininosuccinate lyase [Lachnospiraceae bacterium]
EKGCAIGDLQLTELQEFSPVIDKDVYEAIALKTCVDRRLTAGAPGRAAMEAVIAEDREYLEKSGGIS